MRIHLTKKSIFLTFLLAIVLSFAVACGKSSTKTSESSEPDGETVALSQTSLTLSIGETATITATVTPEGGTVLWDVSNGDSVITFDAESGLITAIGVGEASVTAQVGYSRAECKVTVKQNVVEEYSVSLNRTATQITVGQQINLTATVRLGSNVINDATISWSLVEGDAVVVSQEGVVTAVEEGNAIVRASYTPSGGTPVTADCTFGVLPKPAEYKIYPDGKTSSARYAMIGETFTLNPLVYDADDNPVNFSEDELFITSENPDVVEYLGDGRFRTLQAGKSSIRVEYQGVDGYYEVEVVSFTLTANMMENVREGWTGTVTAREDGKLVYQGEIWTGAVAFTNDGFAKVKQLAETYGYTKLVATVYSLNEACLLNVFGNGIRQIETLNAAGTKAFTENDEPIRFEIDYATFKDWESMQILLTNGWDVHKVNIVFDLTLERYDVTANDQIALVDSTFDFADLDVVVQDSSETIEDLIYGDFAVTSLDTDVLTYANGVFTAKAEGTAVVRVEFGGTAIYVSVSVLGPVYNLTVGMLTGNDWAGGSVTAREDGKLVYHGQTWTGAIILKDDAFATIKQMAEGYGYTTLVATIYSLDQACLLNVFGNGSYQTSSLNVNGTQPFTENDMPLRIEVDYATFKTWEAMQIFLTNGWDVYQFDIVFELTLEQYHITAEDQYMTTGSTINFADLNAVVTDQTGVVEGLTYEDFAVESLNTDVVSYENGVFTAKAEGTAIVRIEYGGTAIYIKISVLGPVYNLTVGMLTGNDWAGGSVTTREDGKLVYHGQTWTSAIVLKDDAFATIKQMAETQGYSKLVVTLYSVDAPQILNIFADGVYNTTSLNVNGATGTFTEDYAPIRYEIDYTTFKDWTAIQVIRSDWAAVNAVFTLTLEKSGITAENQYVTTGSTINFADLNVVVTGATGVVENLTYADFTVTSLNTDVVTYANGVFTTKADGRATVRIEYKGNVTYITVAALNATKVNLATIMGLAGLTPWYAPNATLTDLGGGRLKMENPIDNNCGWQLTKTQLALVRQIAAKFGYNKLTVEVYANPNGILAGNASGFTDKSFFYQVGTSVITTEATDANPIVGTPRDDVLNGAANVITYWDGITIGVHGIGSIEFSIFLEKV